jgi:hypothetical protein
MTIATMLTCAINDLMHIKIERRIGLVKRPWTLLTRYLPGYFNFIPLVLILLVASIFSCNNMSSSREYILLPLLLIFITKLFSSKRKKEDAYFEIISTAAILISLLPLLLGSHSLGWLSFIASAISVKIFNRNTEEPLPLNAVRNLALNCYIIAAYFPNIDFNLSMLLSVVLIYIQDTMYLLIPKFNETRNMRMTFTWTFLFSLLTSILNGVVTIFIGR